MVISAKLNYLRIAPRKVRLLADLVRGKTVEEARAILRFTVKKGSQPLLKLLNSAVANAKSDPKMVAGNLFIAKIEVNEGPKYKRFRARARGQAYEIQKKTSHISVVLGEKKIKKTAKKATPTKKHVSQSSS